MSTPTVKHMDEFAPHWSAILQKDGTLAVTFEIETKLTEIPDVALIELLRAAIVAQIGRTEKLRIVVSGETYEGEFSHASTIRTVIAQAIEATYHTGRRAEEWELRDANGRNVAHSLTLGAALFNFPAHEPFWLSPCCGVGA